jgi:ABC-type multidrug transport system permease subunit
MNLLVLNSLEAIALAIVFLSFAYYFGVRPNVKMNRAMYVLLGISPIGLVVIFAFAFIGLPDLIDLIGLWPSLVINVAAPYIIGAFVGDWIGSKRNYQLPRPSIILLGIVVLIGLFASLYVPYEYPAVHTATTITSTTAGSGG